MDQDYKPKVIENRGNELSYNQDTRIASNSVGKMGDQQTLLSKGNSDGKKNKKISKSTF